MSPPYRDTADIPSTFAESVTLIPPDLLNLPAPPPYTRLPHRPFIIVLVAEREELDSIQL
jgi:hypothetical protein